MISEEHQCHGDNADFLRRASGKWQHRMHILSGSNEMCITCQQNYPLTPLSESSLVKRKPYNFFLDKAEGFAQHCQELEEGWHSKFSSPSPFHFHSLFYLLKKDLFSQVWSVIEYQELRKTQSLKQFHKAINNPLKIKNNQMRFCQLQFCLRRLPIPTERPQSSLLQENIL